jgi:hypothetical protein
MEKQTEQMLVRRLAAFESPWLPIRHHEWSRGPSICAARRTGGIRFWGDGGDSRHRKADQRTRDEAVEAGLMRGNNLTAQGRRAVRDWTWPFNVSLLRQALIRLCDSAADGDCMAPARVPEELIAGEVWQPGCALLEKLFLPLLADGVLESATAYNGRAFYNVANIASFDAVAVTHEFAKRLPSNVIDDIALDATHCGDFRSDLCGLYNLEILRCRKAMLADQTRHQELGQIPLALCPLMSGRDANDLTGIAPLVPNTPEATASDV